MEMNWQKLKELIQSMNYRDFEKLVAALLALLLDTDFKIAKSGYQPRGDAINIEGTIVVQCKKHKDGRSLNRKEIVGDINEAYSDILNLQSYVLAASCNIGVRLCERLNTVEKETGLDIVTLEMTNKLSNLGALCVTFWEDVHYFFKSSDIDRKFLDWIKKESNNLKTLQKIEELKNKLKQGQQSRNQVQKDTEEYLLKRFGYDSNHKLRFNYSINLSESIKRKSLELKISDWWKNPSQPVCYLEGEEGIGKSWLAAKCVNSIYLNENTVIFWLDSNRWKACRSLDDLFRTCFETLPGYQDEEKNNKLKHKIRNIWWPPTLIVLDGVNEGEAIGAATRILDEYFTHRDELENRIRFLLTTRPLQFYRNFKHNLWEGCQKISVLPFSDTELSEALNQKGIQSGELPHSLENIAKIPRYFQTCTRLRHLFRSFDVVPKEIVLWVDLLDKISFSNTQIREKLDWQSIEDAQDILAKLAQEAKWTNVENAPEASLNLLKECFPNYHEIRRDLEEQRIAFKAGKVQAELSQAHIILGWALYLSNLFDTKEFTGTENWVESLQTELEPIPSEDLRTEALFVALQITAISPEPDISHDQLSQKRVALMLAWLNSHNAQITKERISFWVEKDTDAYTQLVEAKFRDQISPNEEDALIEPLAKIWRNKKGQLNHLTSRLTKWLLPTYADEVINGNDIIDPEHLPFPTMDYTRIRLSTAALSILSQRPERHFLPTLARCYVIHEEKPPFNENIGRLMRWGYTETVLGDLYWLAELSQRDDFLLDGVYGLVGSLKLVELPKPLKRPLSEEDKEIRAAVEQWNSSFKPYISRIRDQEQLLKGDSPSANVEGNYHGLDYLAVRKDLLDLRDDDLVKIKEVLQYISENTKLGQHVDATLEDYCIQNLIPWVAKNDPEGYAELACNLKLNTLNQKWAQFKLLSIQGLIFTDKDCEKISTAILGMKERLAQGEDFYSDIAWLTHLLTESLLFCAPDDVLVDWFTFLASQEPLRSSICYKSLPYLFDRLSPASIVELAQQKLEEFRSSSHENHNLSNNEAEEFSEEKFWCTLFAYGSEVEEKTVEYALEDLKMRKPDSTGTFPMLRLAFSDPKRFLDETLIDERIQRHLFSQNSRRWKIRTYEGKNVPSYELLRTFLPIEIIGAFLCAPGRQDDLSRWGKDLIGQMCSMLQGDKENINSVEENRFGINRGVLQTWAEQNQTDFLNLSHEYLIGLSKSPSYQQPLSDFTDVIHCLLLRFQPEKAMKFYQQWSAESVRTIFSNEYGIETLLAQLWKVEQCNSPKHVQLRRTLLEECQNDEEIMFMTIAALAGGGKEELWNLVTHEFLKSHYAKERNLGVSILPWFGTDDAVELLENLKSNDKSWWVRNHAAWAYEIAQQERSCREVYRETLQTRDLFRISAVFEQMIPALSPTAKWWHYQIEEKVELYKESQDNDPKLHALVYRFWYRWGNSSKTKRNVEIWGRKLSEYCRGEKLGFGSPPRLAPWWKPE